MFFLNSSNSKELELTKDDVKDMVMQSIKFKFFFKMFH